MSYFPEAKTKLISSSSQMLPIEIQESRYIIREFPKNKILKRFKSDNYKKLKNTGFMSKIL
jgi:hypothetical protein